MAKVNLYVIKDTVAEECGPVFSAINDGVAIRQLCILMHDVFNVADYLLLCVGRMDTSSCEVEPCHYEVDFISQYVLYCGKLEEKKARDMFITEVSE